jgi:uncharacterized membrane protein
VKVATLLGIVIRVLVVGVLVGVQAAAAAVGIAITVGDLDISLGNVLTVRVELCAAKKWC